MALKGAKIEHEEEMKLGLYERLISSQRRMQQEKVSGSDHQSGTLRNSVQGLDDDREGMTEDRGSSSNNMQKFLSSSELVKNSFLKTEPVHVSIENVSDVGKHGNVSMFSQSLCAKSSLDPDIPRHSNELKGWYVPAVPGITKSQSEDFKVLPASSFDQGCSMSSMLSCQSNRSPVPKVVAESNSSSLPAFPKVPPTCNLSSESTVEFTCDSSFPAQVMPSTYSSVMSADSEGVTHSPLTSARFQGLDHSPVTSAGFQGLDHSLVTSAGLQVLDHIPLSSAGFQGLDHSPLTSAGFQSFAVPEILDEKVSRGRNSLPSVDVRQRSVPLDIPEPSNPCDQSNPSKRYQKKMVSVGVQCRCLFIPIIKTEPLDSDNEISPTVSGNLGRRRRPSNSDTESGYGDVNDDSKQNMLCENEIGFIGGFPAGHGDKSVNVRRWPDDETGNGSKMSEQIFAPNVRDFDSRGLSEHSTANIIDPVLRNVGSELDAVGLEMDVTCADPTDGNSSDLGEISDAGSFGDDSLATTLGDAICEETTKVKREDGASLDTGRFLIPTSRKRKLKEAKRKKGRPPGRKAARSFAAVANEEESTSGSGQGELAQDEVVKETPAKKRRGKPPGKKLAQSFKVVLDEKEITSDLSLDEHDKEKLQPVILRSGRKRFNCQHCSKCFSTASQCAVHEKEAHVLLTCGECAETFTCEDQVQKHYNRKHKGKDIRFSKEIPGSGDEIDTDRRRVPEGESGDSLQVPDDIESDSADKQKNNSGKKVVCKCGVTYLSKNETEHFETIRHMSFEDGPYPSAPNPGSHRKAKTKPKSKYDRYLRITCGECGKTISNSNKAFHVRRWHSNLLKEGRLSSADIQFVFSGSSEDIQRGSKVMKESKTEHFETSSDRSFEDGPYPSAPNPGSHKKTKTKPKSNYDRYLRITCGECGKTISKNNKAFHVRRWHSNLLKEGRLSSADIQFVYPGSGEDIQRGSKVMKESKTEHFETSSDRSFEDGPLKAPSAVYAGSHGKTKKGRKRKNDRFYCHCGRSYTRNNKAVHFRQWHNDEFLNDVTVEDILYPVTVEDIQHGLKVKGLVRVKAPVVDVECVRLDIQRTLMAMMPFSVIENEANEYQTDQTSVEVEEMGKTKSGVELSGYSNIENRRSCDVDERGKNSCISPVQKEIAKRDVDELGKNSCKSPVKKKISRSGVDDKVRNCSRSPVKEEIAKSDVDEQGKNSCKSPVKKKISRSGVDDKERNSFRSPLEQGKNSSYSVSLSSIGPGAETKMLAQRLGIDDSDLDFDLPQRGSYMYKVFDKGVVKTVCSRIKHMLQKKELVLSSSLLVYCLEVRETIFSNTVKGVIQLKQELSSEEQRQIQEKLRENLEETHRRVREDVSYQSELSNAEGTKIINHDQLSDSIADASGQLIPTLESGGDSANSLENCNLKENTNRRVRGNVSYQSEEALDNSGWSNADSHQATTEISCTNQPSTSGNTNDRNQIATKIANYDQLGDSVADASGQLIPTTDSIDQQSPGVVDFDEKLIPCIAGASDNPHVGLANSSGQQSCDMVNASDPLSTCVIGNDYLQSTSTRLASSCGQPSHDMGNPSDALGTCNFVANGHPNADNDVADTNVKSSNAESTVKSDKQENDGDSAKSRIDSDSKENTNPGFLVDFFRCKDPIQVMQCFADSTPRSSSPFFFNAIFDSLEKETLLHISEKLYNSLRVCLHHQFHELCPTCRKSNLSVVSDISSVWAGDLDTKNIDRDGVLRMLGKTNYSSKMSVDSWKMFKPKEKRKDFCYQYLLVVEDKTTVAPSRNYRQRFSCKIEVLFTAQKEITDLASVESIIKKSIKQFDVFYQRFRDTIILTNPNEPSSEQNVGNLTEAQRNETEITSIQEESVRPQGEEVSSPKGLGIGSRNLETSTVEPSQDSKHCSEGMRVYADISSLSNIPDYSVTLLKGYNCCNEGKLTQSSDGHSVKMHVVSIDENSLDDIALKIYKSLVISRFRGMFLTKFLTVKQMGKLLESLWENKCDISVPELLMMYKVREKGVFWCDECKVPLADQVEVDRHLRQACHLTSGQGVKSCPICAKSFAGPILFHRHTILKHHHAALSPLMTHPFTKVPCPHCQKLVFNKSLWRHVETCKCRPSRTQLDVVEPGLCQKCGKLFHTMKDRKNHKHWPENHKVRKPCPYCSKMVIASRLEHHLQTHENTRPHRCEICQKRFKVKITLDFHMKTHTDIREFACPECGQEFRLKVHMQSHLRCHTGDLFECQLCPRAFASKAHLKVHLREKHPENQKAEVHTCKFCCEEFSRLSLLNRHMEAEHLYSSNAGGPDRIDKPTTSRGGQLFECYHCNEKFTKKSHLRQHILSAHQDGSYEKKSAKRSRRKKIGEVILDKKIEKIKVPTSAETGSDKDCKLKKSTRKCAGKEDQKCNMPNDEVSRKTEEKTAKRKAPETRASRKRMKMGPNF